LLVSFVFLANQKAFVICTRVTSLHSCYTFCTRVTEELHSFLSQSELSNFFVYIINDISILVGWFSLIDQNMFWLLKGIIFLSLSFNLWSTLSLCFLLNCVFLFMHGQKTLKKLKGILFRARISPPKIIFKKVSVLA